jgi:hypothetical protein
LGGAQCVDDDVSKEGGIVRVGTQEGLRLGRSRHLKQASEAGI